MLKNIFHYIYCMPISETILAMIFVCFLWRFIEKIFFKRKKEKLWRYLNFILFLIWFISVSYMTVFSRNQENGFILQPFHFIIAFFTNNNEEVFRTAWMNVLLFVPGGLFLFQSLKAKYKKRVLIVSLVLLLFSIGIESSQYFLKCGLTETDDVMCNSFGAIIGATSYTWVLKLRDKLIKVLKKI